MEIKKSQSLSDHFLDTIVNNLVPAAKVPHHLSADPIRYIETYLKIKSDKKIEYKNKLIRFVLRKAQRVLQKEIEEAPRNGFGQRKVLLLKCRRPGATSLEQGKSFHMACTQPHTKILTLADNAAKAQEIFRMVNRFYDNLDPKVRPKRSPSTKDLVLPELDSVFGVHTAGSKTPGRGDTLDRVHGSEVAYWDLPYWDLANLVAGLDDACGHGEMIFETTANGAQGWFYDTWRDAIKGLNDWTPIFFPWYKDPENRIRMEPEEVLTYTEEEKDVIKKYDLFDSQIKFRRQMQRKHRKLFQQEYPESWELAFLTKGDSFFELGNLTEWINRCKELDSSSEEQNGLRIWYPPEPGNKYFIGSDVAEGNANSNYSTAAVLDRAGRQCAALQGRWSLDTHASKLASLGHRYNKATIAVERNNHGHGVLLALRQIERYPRIFKHKDYNIKMAKEGKDGWHTGGGTRTMMLNALKDALHDGSMEVNDSTFLSECTTFVKDDTGKYKAGGSSYDDLVIAWAIAWQVLYQNPHPARILM